MNRSPGPIWAARSKQLRSVGRRSNQVLVISALVGVTVGLAVAAFDAVTADGLLSHVLDLPLAVAACAPVVGLVVAAAALRWLAPGTSPATSDEYIRAFHEPARALGLRPLAGRLVAAAASLGLGGAMGYEGPAIYAGAAIGSSFQRRLSRFFGPEDAKVLLVAGAAAGVAAIFKAPLTGIVFALEVPYQNDLARRNLLPAAIAAAASYVTFVALAGTTVLLPVGGGASSAMGDLAGAAAVGLAAGVLARLFILILGLSKRVAATDRPFLRAVAGGATLGVLFLAGHALTGTNQTMGPGYDSLRWALDPRRGAALIVLVASMRVFATATTVAAGGVGGLFIPLVVQGALLGRVASGVFGSGNPTLLPVVGIAAFLGAGYRVPLSGVVFVAEFTGRPGFVVPGLLAAVVAQLVMGRSSVSPYQVAGRVGHLERRLRLPLAAALDAEARTVPPDCTVEELFWQHLVGARRRTVAVVDGSTLCGLVGAEALARVSREDWALTSVRDVLRSDVPAASPAWTIAEAIAAMEEAQSDLLAVCHDGKYVGVISSADVLQLGDLLGDSGLS